jgi:long-chain acyl-CoA synthetase
MAERDHKSVAALLHWRIEKTPNQEAFSYPDDKEKWHSMSWKDVHGRVRNIAMGLRALGIDDEERVAIFASTSIQWILADLGILCAGAACTTIYPSNTADECEYILNDSKTKIVFAEDEEKLATLNEVKDKLGGVTKVILFKGEGDGEWAISLKKLEEMGAEKHKEDEAAYEKIWQAIEPERLATLIYTSGTTGTPKGVELIHDCWLFTGEGMEALGFFQKDEKQFLWLPMAHSFGKVLEVATIRLGIPTAVDGRVPNIVPNLSIVRPTFMGAPPRIFEKVYNKIVSGAEAAGGAKLAIFKWSLKTGKEVSAVKQKGGEPSGLLALKYKIAHKLVFSKLTALFGGRVRFFISGSAPLSRDMAEFFHAAGVLILEGYGLTESSAASFVNLLDHYKFGTVGKALQGTDLKIAEDGEILFKSRGVMRGYHNLPDKTAETLNPEGYLHTGDIGEVDKDGFLKITDRKKDLIKTSGGKYVAPQHLESRVKALCPYVGQVLVHGNNRNFCVALVTMDPESLPAWADDNGVSYKDLADLTTKEPVKKLVSEAVDTMNSELPSYSTVKYFEILPQEWSIESGELTPSFKVKRKVVEENHADILEGFYEGQLKKAV